MIKINVLEPLWLQKAKYLYEKKFRERTFAGRNPQLGKMINCAVCERRHREYPACKPVYAIQDKQGNTYQEIFDGEKWAPLAMQASNESHKGMLGAAMFARKRINPHHSASILQFVAKVKQYYDEYYPYFSDPKEAHHEAMKMARSRALNESTSDIRRRIAQAQRSTGLSTIGHTI